MSIAELGLYEAVMALIDHRSRRSQYFTPDDVAASMASYVMPFPQGRRLDPYYGVGNLSWHLAQKMVDLGEFVACRLLLIDLDPVALETASAYSTRRHEQ